MPSLPKQSFEFRKWCLIYLSFSLNSNKFLFFFVYSSFFGPRTSLDPLCAGSPFPFTTCLPPPPNRLPRLCGLFTYASLNRSLPFFLHPISLILHQSLSIFPTVPTLGTKSRCLRRTCLTSTDTRSLHSTVPLRAFQLQTKSPPPQEKKTKTKTFSSPSSWVM